ncbi:hypothetical protein FHY55_12175 [Oceanicola sp. D3]|uniref:hypothetical protein n=1 Tax=Oceanicola sp. D3 TaxID=2587163 RepID=UPI00111E8C4C|nr:hypothetical protein [Oceanicola sp. D3]QDC09952.1 hypothetical protein FHY55_12175 [Oceanicola sp. D3]
MTRSPKCRIISTLWCLLTLAGCGTIYDEHWVVVGSEATLDVPDVVGVHSIEPESAAYDPDRPHMTLTFRSVGTSPIRLPARAVMRSMILTYSAGGLSQSFRRTESRSDMPEVVTLSSGESISCSIGFDFPRKLLSTSSPNVHVEICAIWDAASFDVSSFPDEGLEFIDSFRACDRTRLTR